MPKIYELLGYPITDNSPQVQESRSRAYCPFISDICDGGGNRYMSDINLADHQELSEKFPGMTRVPSGVCSIQVTDNSSPWIICPRRLLYMGRKANADILKGETQKKLYEKCDYPQGTVLGIWAETKVKYSNDDSEKELTAFDYTFDYVLMPLGRASKDEAVAATGLEWSALQKMLRDNGYTFAQREGET